MVGINKPGGLLAVNSFSQLAMKKGVFDIHLMDWPGM
jgi:hypothetical protein